MMLDARAAALFDRLKLKQKTQACRRHRHAGAIPHHRVEARLRADRIDDRRNLDLVVIAMPYRHTQSGTWIVTLCLAVAVLDAAIAWRTGQWLPVVVLVVLIAVAVLFSSLTVEVSDHELRWYFGPGLWTYRLPLDDIEKVAVMRNHWWNGFGIRMRAGFRLYNVSGFDAVELRLKSNDVRRIGTDDPQGLAAALTSAVGKG
jgi:hypothetical protein